MTFLRMPPTIGTPPWNPNAGVGASPAPAGGIIDILRGQGTDDQKARLQRGILGALASMSGERGLAGALGAYGAGQIHAQDWGRAREQEEEEKARRKKFDDYLRGRIEETTDPAERERLEVMHGTGRYLPPSSPGRPVAPKQFKRTLPDGREIVERWDPNSGDVRQVGEPYTPSAGSGAGSLTPAQSAREVERRLEWDWFLSLDPRERALQERLDPSRVRAAKRVALGETEEQYRARLSQLELAAAASDAPAGAKDAGPGVLARVRGAIPGILANMGISPGPRNPVVEELDRDYPAPSLQEPAPEEPLGARFTSSPKQPERTTESVNREWRGMLDFFRQDPSLGVIGYKWDRAGLERLAKAARERTKLLERQAKVPDPHSQRNAAAWKQRAEKIREALAARDWVEVDKLMRLGLGTSGH